MNTKFDVGDKVLVEGIIKNIKIDSAGLLYGIEFCSKVHNFREEEVHPMDENDDGVKEAYEATLRALGNIENGN